jgi:hypothetical protein
VTDGEHGIDGIDGIEPHRAATEPHRSCIGFRIEPRPEL